MTNLRDVFISQKAIVSTINSSSSGLSAGAVFTGAAESTLGVAGIQVSLKTDQNSTINIDQSPDGINWDLTDVYNYYASINNFGVTVQAVNSYFRVRVTNTSTVNQTYFRLQSVLCPVIEAVPRSVDSMGNFKTAIRSMEDTYGFEVENTPMGEMRTVTPVRLVGAGFEGNTIDPQFWTTSATSSGGASVTQANGQITITSGTTAYATASLSSFRRARYVGGSSMRYRTVFQLGDTGTAHNTRRWGIGYGATMPTITDGVYFQLNGTLFGIRILKTGVATPTFAIDSGSFNGVLGATWTPGTNATTYEIYYTSTKVYFVIGGDLLHTITSTADTWADTKSFYSFADSVNDGTGITPSVTMKLRVSSIYRLGLLETAPHWFHISGNAATYNLKYSPGILRKIIFNNNNGNTVTLYDAVAGTTNAIAVLTNNTSGLAGANDWNLPFYNGLTVVTAGNGLDCTILYE